MSEKDLDKIEPVDFDLTESPLFSNQAAQVVSNKPSAKVLITLAGLMLVALFVIFVLPTVVTEYELPLERRADNIADQALSALPNPATTISPFEAAQRALQRKEAQDVLAELLGKQAELDGLNVAQWAESDYDEALEKASIGDDYYRTQDFELAQDSYAQGREALVLLLDSVPVVVSRTLIDAQQTFEAGDSEQALAKYDLALLLDPESEAAAIGLQRSEALEEVKGLLAQADELFESGELELAQEVYQQALKRDSYNDRARARVNETAALITENEFSKIMSRGYMLLESGEPEQAIAAFQLATGLGIHEEQALAAITQTENEIANAEINQIRGIITQAEGDEQWQLAVDEYDKVLAIDANLLFAISGRDYAGKRARLDRLLVEGIDNPHRFSEDAVFEQILDVYYTGRAIDPPGPVLIRQLDVLEGLLENSQIAIEIQLVSDRFTEVTLLRIGNLGKFEQQSISLKPGRYVAVGRRSGYREVREEFTVGFGRTPSSVVVRCEERVVATNGR